MSRVTCRSVLGRMVTVTLSACCGLSDGAFRLRTHV